MGQQKPHEVQEREMLSPVPAEEKPQAPAHAGGPLAAKQLFSEGPESLGGQDAVKVDVSQQCALVTKKTDIIWCSIKQSIGSKSRQMILLFYSALLRYIWSSGSSSGLPSTRR